MASGFWRSSCLCAAALAGALSLTAAGPAQAVGVTVFASDFDTGSLPVQIDPGSAALTAVQGFAGVLCFTYCRLCNSKF